MHCARPTAWGASFAKVLGRCPTAIKLSLEALVTRARSQAPAWECSIPGGSSLLPGLQKHGAPERNGRLEPPRQGRSQAGAWERASHWARTPSVGRKQIGATWLVGTGDTKKLRSVGCKFRGAHPSRVLVEASRLDELLAWMRLQPSESEDRKAIRWPEVRAGGTPAPGTPAPARETRALPGARSPTSSQESAGRLPAPAATGSV